MTMSLLDTLLEAQPTASAEPAAKVGLPRAGLTWFEIATADIHRAHAFYRTVLGEPLTDVSHDEPMFMFPAFGGEVTGALVQRPQQTPSIAGTLVYLRIAGTLQAAMARVEAAGGALFTPALTVPNVAGAFCVIRDTEGNHVGLHAEM